MSKQSSLLTAYECSRLTGMSVQYIYSQLSTGKISGQKIDGKWQVNSDAFMRQFAHRLKPAVSVVEQP